jgi:hypothetical protein
METQLNRLVSHSFPWWINADGLSDRHLATIRKGEEKISEGRVKSQLGDRQALERMIGDGPQYLAHGSQSRERGHQNVALWTSPQLTRTCVSNAMTRAQTVSCTSVVFLSSRARRLWCWIALDQIVSTCLGCLTGDGFLRTGDGSGGDYSSK